MKPSEYLNAPWYAEIQDSGSFNHMQQIFEAYAFLYSQCINITDISCGPQKHCTGRTILTICINALGLGFRVRVRVKVRGLGIMPWGTER